MGKPNLRPLRLTRLRATQPIRQGAYQPGNGSEKSLERMAGEQSPAEAQPRTTLSGRLAFFPATEDAAIIEEGAEAEARHLLKRTPGSYLLNQAYGLWFFVSSF